MENALAKVFDPLKVERVKRGVPIDLFVYNGLGRRLAVEVTGVSGVFKNDDSHLAHILTYIPEHHSNNLRGMTERIILEVNTRREKPLEKQSGKEDITKHAKDIIVNNHVCVIRSCDLSDLWLKTLGGLSLSEEFDTLFDAEVMYEPI